MFVIGPVALVQGGVAVISRAPIFLHKDTQRELFWGFASALAFVGLVIMVGFLAHAAIMKGNQNAMTMIPQIISAATMLFGIPAAILGVASWHRGKEKRIIAGEKNN